MQEEDRKNQDQEVDSKLVERVAERLAEILIAQVELEHRDEGSENRETKRQ